MNAPKVTDSGSDNLALLYQGLLTSMVRVRLGAQEIDDCVAFRKQILEVLRGVEQEAIRLGYREEDVRNANYAIVAFLDESILNSNDPNRQFWASLQSQLYGEAVAGESFFTNLDGLRNRRDSPQIADILEVYYLCLLMGYRGRYAGYAREHAAELGKYRDELRTRIEAIRGRELVFWKGPRPGLQDANVTSSTEGTSARSARFRAILSLAIVAVLWVLCRSVLYWQASDVQTGLIP